MAIAAPPILSSYSGRTRAPAPTPMATRIVQVLPALLLFYSFLVPPEVAVYLGSLRMGAYRLALLILVPYIVVAVFKQKIRFHFLDLLLVITALWLPASLTIHYDLATGLEAGGRQTYDMILAYFVARACIDSFDKLRNLLIFLLPGLMLVGGLLFLESVIGRPFVRQIFQQIFGNSGEVGSELRILFRLGFFRAYSVFTHPIHAGIFLSSFLAFYFYMFRNVQWRYSGVVTSFLAFFTLSSAGLLALAMQCGFLFYDWLQKRVRDLSWGLALAALGVTLFLAHMFSQNGLIAVVYSYLTLNPATGRFRTLIWQYAGDVALQNPWLGIGHEEYARPDWMGTGSIDAHYLFMALTYGMPSAILYFSLAIAIIYLLCRRAAASHTTLARNGYMAMTTCLTVTLILMFTVTFWGAILSWFNFMLGAALALVTWRKNLDDGRIVERGR
ncbi:O-antigen ligase family protein [Parasphingorhabdus sp. DH2-15]|uniref:O-antigen ligase family protein n=1 Tax=Parasphingorhabdus sp. DH2-15 TaxID=3444112 RepID=UPI003F6863C0